MTLPRIGTPTILGFAIAALILASVPWLVPAYVSFELTFAGAYAIAILGLIILTGYNGQISLGHGAFMAIGGYTVAIAGQAWGLAPELSILLSALLCGLFGALVGIVALRLAGAYLALATYSLAVAVAPVLKRFKDLTGGAQGLTLTPLHVPAPFAALGSERYLYYETWFLAAVLFAASWFALQGRLGRALRALRDNEIAAISFGINASYYKSLAFAWSAALAGIAGSLIALATAYVSPDGYSLVLSLTLLIGAVLGGLSSLWGALAGGLVVEFLPIWAGTLNPAASSLIYGIALIVVMIVVPAGIVGAIQRAVFTITRPRTEGTSRRS